MMEAGPFRTLPACAYREFETDLGVDCPGFVEVQQLIGKTAKLWLLVCRGSSSIDLRVASSRDKGLIMRAAYRRPVWLQRVTTNVSHWHALHDKNFFLQRRRTCHSYQWLNNTALM